MGKSEREILIADICHLLDRAKLAHLRAMHPPSSWGSTVHAFAYQPGPADQAFRFACATRGLTSATWRAESRDYVNYLWRITDCHLRAQILAGMPNRSLWEIFLLLAEP